eukprot:1941680-Amphidinium_carterae.2
MSQQRHRIIDVIGKSERLQAMVRRCSLPCRIRRHVQCRNHCQYVQGASEKFAVATLCSSLEVSALTSL